MTRREALAAFDLAIRCLPRMRNEASSSLSQALLVLLVQEGWRVFFVSLPTFFVMLVTIVAQEKTFSLLLTHISWRIQNFFMRIFQRPRRSKLEFRLRNWLWNLILTLHDEVFNITTLVFCYRTIWHIKNLTQKTGTQFRTFNNFHFWNSVMSKISKAWIRWKVFAFTKLQSLFFPSCLFWPASNPWELN